MKRKIEILILSIYTIINLRFMWSFIFRDGYALGVAAGQNSNGLSFMALFIGAFLNAALIIYWLNKNENVGKTNI